MKTVVLDNYDSFTWNLVHGLEAAGARCLVHRSDSLTLSQLAALEPARIVLSPGPFGPDQTGICRNVVEEFSGRVPILGVCLGMQVIAQTLGAHVHPSGHPVHGKASKIHHDDQGLLRGLPNPFQAGRYHSLIVEPPASSVFIKTAWTDDGIIMGCRMRNAPTEGVLFHPESFLTEHGARIFANFMSETSPHVV